MKGTLKFTDAGWVVKWSDLHSFAHGTIWMYTELHPDTKYMPYTFVENDVVEFELVSGGFNEGDYGFNKYARIVKIYREVLTPEELSSSKPVTPVKTVDEQELLEKFLKEFTDIEGKLVPCNPDAIFNWFAWNVWRKT